jgi:hypothetical protein
MTTNKLDKMIVRLKSSIHKYDMKVAKYQALTVLAEQKIRHLLNWRKEVGTKI